MLQIRAAAWKLELRIFNEDFFLDNPVPHMYTSQSARRALGQGKKSVSSPKVISLAFNLDVSEVFDAQARLARWDIKWYSQ